MTVTTSYPGVYIQELPSLVHTITPAPTSIAVFVGYTHPFLTQNAEPISDSAIQLFSFADYQTNFGGFFSSPWQPDYVGQAVYQFFLNGGPSLLRRGPPGAQYYDDAGPAHTGTSPVPSRAASLPTRPYANITFTALQPVGVAAAAPATGSGHPDAGGDLERPEHGDRAPLDNDMADIVISYGTTVETYRQVAISRPRDDAARTRIS